MKIYFSAAIAQKNIYGKYYDRMVAALEADGHTVFQDTTEVSLDEAVNKSLKQRQKYYRHVLNWISKSDIVFLEVSFPSTLHIGHEVSLALERGRPVVALYYKGKEPCFFLGIEEDKIFWSDYDEHDLESVVREGIRYADSQKETRFNLYLSPKHVAHLESVTRNTKNTRSSYLRRLIENDIQRLREKK